MTRDDPGRNLRPVTITEAPSAKSPLKTRIRWAREHSRSKTNPGHISQERFAGLIGTSRRHLMRIENGTHTPRPALIERIAEESGHDLAFFLDGDDEEESDRVANMTLDQFLESRVRKLLRKIQGEDGSLVIQRIIRSRLTPAIWAWVA